MNLMSVYRRIWVGAVCLVSFAVAACESQKPSGGADSWNLPILAVSSEPTVVLTAGVAFVVSPRAPTALANVYLYTSGDGYLTGFRPSVDAVPGRLTPVAILDNGGFLVRVGSEIVVMGKPPEPGTVTSDSTQYGVYFHTDQTDSLVLLPRVVRQWSFSYRWVGGPIPTGAAPYPFGLVTHVAVGGDRIMFINDATGAVQLFDQNGALVSAATPTFDTRPFEADALTAHLNLFWTILGRELLRQFRVTTTQDGPLQSENL
jgi:hypothetical protein